MIVAGASTVVAPAGSVILKKLVKHQINSYTLPRIFSCMHTKNQQRSHFFLKYSGEHHGEFSVACYQYNYVTVSSHTNTLVLCIVVNFLERNK